jgi:hypothetical protein
MNSD